jgi:hypothetical protein
VSMSREKVHVAGEDREPWEILGLFLRGMLKFPGVMEVEKNINCVASIRCRRKKYKHCI